MHSRVYPFTCSEDKTHLDLWIETRVELRPAHWATGTSFKGSLLTLKVKHQKQKKCLQGVITGSMLLFEMKIFNISLNYQKVGLNDQVTVEIQSATMQNQNELQDGQSQDVRVIEQKQPQYIKNMPTLKQAVKMSFAKVCLYLSKIPTSDYFGIDRRDVSRLITKNDAYIYLNDLIVINDRVKSNLYQISQESDESMASGSSHANSMDKELVYESLEFKPCRRLFHSVQSVKSAAFLAKQVIELNFDLPKVNGKKQKNPSRKHRSNDIAIIEQRQQLRRANPPLSHAQRDGQSSFGSGIPVRGLSSSEDEDQGERIQEELKEAEPQNERASEEEENKERAMEVLSSITDNNVDENDQVGSPRPFSRKEQAKAMEDVKALLSKKNVALYTKPLDFETRATGINLIQIRQVKPKVRIPPSQLGNNGGASIQQVPDFDAKNQHQILLAKGKPNDELI